jgi:mannose-6-phosphate isomerase
VISTVNGYPFLLAPKESPAIWGGDALVKKYGKPGDPHAAIGESWECWDENRVRNGTLAGKTLGELRCELGTELMGTLDATQIFPVLTKFIDARQALSVQVHPDDAYAQRVEHQANGKTECWYILNAQPGAELVLGWTRDTDRVEYERRVADGTLADILRRVPVAPGDVFYLPAGTLHAIGAGIELFEVQQASDLTYRIFDWNRVGTDGKPRELHVAKAADVLDFRATFPGAVRTVRLIDGALDREFLIAAPRFLVEHVRITAPGGSLATAGVPLTITALGTPLALRIGDSSTQLAAYETVVTPASASHVALEPIADQAEVLVVHPEPNLKQLGEMLRESEISIATVEEFLGQFQK